MSLHWGGRGPGHSGRKQVVTALPTTWSTTDKDAAITLSDANLTATGNGAAWKSVRGINARSDKRYFEALFSTSGAGGTDVAIGVAQSDAALTTFFGADANAVVYGGPGQIFYNGGFPFVGAYTAGDRIGIAWNGVTGTFWVSKNGVWLNGDPSVGTDGQATAVTGPAYPGFSALDAEGMTANFGASAFTYAVPTGFSAWG